MIVEDGLAVGLENGFCGHGGSGEIELEKVGESVNSCCEVREEVWRVEE